jgi:PIN domain nuclease of toxin-antitoxin system
MTVLDSQALLALLFDEPAADRVEEILRGSDGVPQASGITCGEVTDVLVRRTGHRADEAWTIIQDFIGGGLEIVPVNEAIGHQAGLLRSRHWHRDRRSVSLADCVVLATGMLNHEAIATADAALIGAARAESHPVIVLPDSQGRRAP